MHQVAWRYQGIWLEAGIDLDVELGIKVHFLIYCIPPYQLKFDFDSDQKIYTNNIYIYVRMDINLEDAFLPVWMLWRVMICPFLYVHCLMKIDTANQASKTIGTDSKLVTCQSSSGTHWFYFLYLVGYHPLNKI